MFSLFKIQRLIANTRHLHTEQLKKGLIHVIGKERKDFLQGLLTNDIHHLTEYKPGIYSHVLNNLGRVMYDVIISNDKNNPDACFIECDINVLTQLTKHLKIYKLRRKVDIIPVSDNFNVWVIFGDDLEQISTEGCEPSDVPSLISDPRLKCLGYRMILAKDKTPGDVVKPEKSLNISESDYKLLRYKKGVAEGSEEIVPGKSLPLEFNCDFLNGVSFHKGCYIGQELTARTNYTGVVRKRIMPIDFSSPIPADTTAEIVNEKNKSVGKLKAVHNLSGLGLIRITDALNSSSLSVCDITVKISKPDWWPIDVKS